eukprot:CAMPEP_0168446960 /NCGR_PEP_ID=MMETSP0228-20121227/46347_1 /TAXON_ID=133427 /ORGANISM="Protoceratium reticulatum, Strain CCCM 535 (=CCMP 1889)" /LENGTH=290 /DNA_ID=CAMNT_0008461477 /DNA_START=44 /DNA_END=916 /DNA_ORIENTATION=-
MVLRQARGPGQAMASANHARPVPAAKDLRRRHRWLLLAVAAAGVAACGLPRLAVPEPSPKACPPPEQDAAGSSGNRQLADALRGALAKVDALRADVDGGNIIQDFGEKAEATVKGLAPELQSALDGALYALFIRQLELIREELIEKFERHWRPTKALSLADQQFVARADELVRPGSDWSYTPERAALRLAQEKARGVQTQRATASVIGNLQKQMEQLGEKLRGTGAASPWVFWTSYRIPGTPIQMSGRYQQGRTNIELNLAPNKDPANAEAGFVEGLTWSNLGLSLNLGV